MSEIAQQVQISMWDVQPKEECKIVQFPGQWHGDLPIVRANLAGRKPTQAAESLTCYNEIKAMSDYLLSAGTYRYRNNALFITGISTGFRISDLVRLKVCDVVDVNTRSFKDHIDIYEKKTGKRTVSRVDEVVVTESMRWAITLWLDSINWRLSSNECLFKSRKKNSAGEYRLDESQGYRIITEAAEGVGLQEHVGSHTLRKTFLNIAYILASVSNLRGMGNALAACQVLARHSSAETTSKYMNLQKPMSISLREGVSAFIMGKTKIKDLKIGYDIDMALDEECDEE